MAPTQAFIPSISSTLSKPSVISSSISSPVLQYNSSPLSTTPRLHPLCPPAFITSSPLNNPNGLPSKPSRILFLFHDDLRLIDNRALVTALNDSKKSLNGTFIPAILNTSCTKYNQTFVNGVEQDIKRLGSTMLKLQDFNTIGKLCKQLKLDGVYMNYTMDKSGALLQHRLNSYLKQNVQIDLYLYWGNSMINKPLNCYFNNTTSSKQQKQQHPSVLKLYKDIVKQPMKETIELIQTPTTLPDLPVEAKSFNTLTSQQSNRTSIHPTNSNHALNILSKSFNKHHELLSISKQKDLIITIKPYLDAGVLSLSMVANHISQIFNGQLKGRTFSELVWRNYTSFVSNTHLIKVTKNNKVYA